MMVEMNFVNENVSVTNFLSENVVAMVLQNELLDMLRSVSCQAKIPESYSEVCPHLKRQIYDVHNLCTVLDLMTNSTDVRSTVLT